METNLNVKSRTSRGSLAMMRTRFYYLDSAERRQLEELLPKEKKSSASASFLDEIKKLLPIEKWNDVSLRKHVEGLVYLSERLWTMALEIGRKNYGADFSRDNLLRITKTMPMSHYRYLTGSREPADVLMTRDDALQDPATAMVKLKRDIEALMEFIQSVPK